MRHWGVCYNSVSHLWGKLSPCLHRCALQKKAQKQKSPSPHINSIFGICFPSATNTEARWLLIPTRVFPILMHRSSCLCYDHGQFAGASATLNVMLTRLETGGVHVKCNKCFGLGCILTMWASGWETLFTHTASESTHIS